MRQEIITSGIVHALAVGALFVGVNATREVKLPGSDVVEVALIGASVAPEPHAPEARAPEKVAPSGETGVKLEQAPKSAKPPAPKPEAVPLHQKTSPKSTSAPITPTRTTLASEAIGGGMRGDLVVDGDFTFGFYLQRIRSLIAANWAPPAGNTTGTRVELYFRVARDGTLSAPSVETASGNAYFDQTAQRAVIITAKLPPLPQGYDGSDLGVHLGFEYSGP